MILLLVISGCQTKYGSFYNEAKNSNLLEYDNEKKEYITKGIIATDDGYYYRVLLDSESAYIIRYNLHEDGPEPSYSYFWYKGSNWESISSYDNENNELSSCEINSNCDERDKRAVDNVRRAGSLFVDNIDKYIPAIDNGTENKEYSFESKYVELISKGYYVVFIEDLGINDVYDLNDENYGFMYMFDHSDFTNGLMMNINQDGEKKFTITTFYDEYVAFFTDDSKYYYGERKGYDSEDHELSINNETQNLLDSGVVLYANFIDCFTDVSMDEFMNNVKTVSIEKGHEYLYDLANQYFDSKNN